MRIVYLDTETSGFEPGQIAQLSYILEDDDTIIKRVNQFFKVNSVDEGAAKVTGLTKEVLDGLSEGRVFADRANEFYNDMNGAVVIAHNAVFDNKFVSAEMERVGINYRFQPRFCTMQYLTNIIKLPGRYGKYKWPNVAESLQFLGIADAQVFELARWLYGDSAGLAHDARFDMCAVYLIVRELKKRQILNLEHNIIIQG